MKFNHKLYRLNSLRNGFMTNDKLYGKPLIIVACASQSKDIDKIHTYKKYNDSHNILIQPCDINFDEPGDDYEIYHYYENMLNVEFPICEKIEFEHKFFQDFGKPKENFTNYLFDEKLVFQKKFTGDLDE